MAGQGIVITITLSVRVIVIGSFDKGSSFSFFFSGPYGLGKGPMGMEYMQAKHSIWDFLYFKEISEEHEIL